MAWSFDAGFLERGESTTWAFWWARNEYAGIQVVQAKPRPSVGGGIGIVSDVTLRVTSQALRMDLSRGYTYYVTVTNLDGLIYRYDIVGTRVDE
jgi:hypothetical protein